MQNVVFLIKGAHMPFSLLLVLNEENAKGENQESHVKAMLRALYIELY